MQKKLLILYIPILFECCITIMHYFYEGNVEEMAGFKASWVRWTWKYKLTCLQKKKKKKSNRAFSLWMGLITERKGKGPCLGKVTWDGQTPGCTLSLPGEERSHYQLDGCGIKCLSNPRYLRLWAPEALRDQPFPSDFLMVARNIRLW